MEIITSRFGQIAVDRDDILRFPLGLIGMPDCHDWVLLADAEHDALAWLQCIDRPKVALAVVSPRRFVPDYQLRVSRRELAVLELREYKRARVLVVVGSTAGVMTLNLKAPLVINPDRHLGRQLVARGELPLTHELVPRQAALRRSA